MLREEKNRLTELQTMQREDFNARREHERELRTVSVSYTHLTLPTN